MTEQTNSTRIPGPLYAAAGAGDLAYQQLRKLPAKVTELSEKAAAGTGDLRAKAAATLRAANTTAATLRDRASSTDFDADRLREAAKRNAAAVVAGAQAAQERAVEFYGTLVAHGERVVGSGVVRTADTVNADIEATEAPAEVTAGPETPAEEQAEKPAKPAKRTRPAAK
jgi:heparin binding hemagglutinin HbhA